jgi:predicted NACHT family NTPase
MLLIMALIHRSGKGLPDRRVDLYNLCVNVLLEHWNRENEKEYIPAAAGRAVLAPLAFWMHQKPGRYTASLAELTPVIGPELERTPQLPQRDPVKFLESVRDLSGLFTGQSEDEFAFLHPSFQEYLAAEYVRAEPDRTRRPAQRQPRS